MKDIIFNNEIWQEAMPFFKEALRLFVFIPLIILLIRWVRLLYAKKEIEKPVALLVSEKGTEKYEIKAYETAIGRMSDSDIVLNYPFISRNHAVIAFRNGEWIIFDTASKSGVTVNGKKIKKCYALLNGDTVGFAGLNFIFSAKDFKKNKRK